MFELLTQIPARPDTFVVLTSHNDGGSPLYLILLLLGGFLLGLYLVYDGYDKWKTKRLVEDTPTEKVRSMAVGRTELEGTARAADETISAPFSDDECVYVSWRVEELRGYGDDEDWETVAQEEAAVPFYLDDGTGEVLVEGWEAEYDVSEDNYVEEHVDDHEDRPERIQAFYESGGPRGRSDDGDDGLAASIKDSVTVRPSQFDFDVNTDPVVNQANPLGSTGGQQADAVTLDDTGRQRKYYQRVVPDGEDVYVLGSAQPRDDGQGTAGGQLKMTRDPGLDVFLVSDRSEEELEQHYERWGPLEIVGGLVVSAGCLGGLLLVFQLLPVLG